MRKTIGLFIVSIFIVGCAWADLLTPNATNTCDFTANPAPLVAVFLPNKYTCNSGYYLPADTDGCTPCVAGRTCGGGTYTFNSSKSQGEILAAPVTTTVAGACTSELLQPNQNGYTNKFIAFFAPNTHTCPAGYYLPADVDACTKCPANSYCPGGTYTFNETTNQGIMPCPNDLYAPAGMSSADQCGRILHIGNDVMYLHSVKKTTPALNAKVGNDIFYGNMTVADVVMNANTNRKLKVRYNDTIYSIYDDTVVVQ